MDEGIGNITIALQEKGMLSNTLIVFTTDNGGPTSQKPGYDNVGSSNWPLRGGKHSIFEGGSRGVAAVWAGDETRLLPQALRGTKATQLMHGADWLPTLCGIVGASEQCARLPLDGVDQRGPLFANLTAARQEVLYGQPDAPSPGDALRDGDGWKLIVGDPGLPYDWSARWGYDDEEDGSQSSPESMPPFQLFNVLSDPREEHEVSEQYPDIVARLTARFQELRRTATNGEILNEADAIGCGRYEERFDKGLAWEPWCLPPRQLVPALRRMVGT